MKMSNGQWEVVGKSKKDKSAKIKDDKRNGSKLDSYIVNDDEERKPGKENKKKDGNDQKKPKKQDKKSELAKPTPPKTIEGALQAIDNNELANIIATNKIRFSNAPLVWLKEVAIFLNSKIQIDVDDPTFSNQPPNFPLNVLPNDIKELLESILQDAGKAHTQLFFDVTLTAVANDMSRGQSVNGHRLLLQMLAYEYPEFTVESLTKSASLRNSYQNRPPIGLTLLWALGQGGSNNFTVGLQAWQELFLPIIELRNYSKYIVTYLIKLLDNHIQAGSAKMSQEQFLSLLESINTKKNGLSKDLQSDLNKQLIKIKDIYFNNSGNKLQVTFNHLMKKMPNQYIESNNLDPFQKVLVQSLVDCLERDDSCNATWRQLFNRCSKQSATLLSYIGSNWDETRIKLKLKSLKATVIQYKEVCGEALKGKKKDETVVKANRICQDILEKMARTTSRFPWFWVLLGLLISIAGLVSFDIHKSGGDFKKSASGQLLKDSQFALDKALTFSARGYLWLEANAPIYYEQGYNASKPYIELARDFVKVSTKNAIVLYGNVKEYVIEKAPVVQDTIDQYAPGLVDSVVGYTKVGWDTARNYTTEGYVYVDAFLKEKVLVGQLSPQNIAQATQSAVNVTCTQVSGYLVWLRQQIDVYSEKK